MIKRLSDEFYRLYQCREDAIFFSPGRVNLIGEHTDYNGGMVFPCAITIGTYALAKKRSDRRLRLYSNNFKEKGIIEVTLDDLHYAQKDDWANYVKGVFYHLQKAGFAITHGFDLLIEGNIPNGSGLSSSASLEVLIAVIAKDLLQLSMDPITMVKLCQTAENEFIGVNCGIMDQFIIAMGKKDQAVALDTGTLAYTHVPVSLQDACIVIMNTNKKRELADSKYNERRGECEAALKELQGVVEITHICDLTPAQLEEYRYVIADETRYRRVKHAVSEHARVKKAIEALKRNDIAAFGELMNESHISLRDDYEVTGKELDTLVSSAWKQEGVIGARMTGAGFGGCAIALVKREALEAFQREVSTEYERIIGYPCSFYIAQVGEGAGRITK